MKKHSLSKNGLSLSQAQSISNLLNQRSVELTAQFNSLNVCSKTIKLNGETFEILPSSPVPANIVELIKKKAQYHGCQAFLMENIKAKDQLLLELRQKPFTTELQEPQEPEYQDVIMVNAVSEQWGWEQLSRSEMEEYYEIEAMAAHIGQFIHKEGKLSQMRNALVSLPVIEWITVKDGEKTPVIITKNTSSAELLQIHEQLAILHREYEQRVNYFKAKVKNLVTEENALRSKVTADKNAEIQRVNNVKRKEYENAYAEYREKYLYEQQMHNHTIEAGMKDIVALRIEVPARFKGIIDEIMPPK